MHMKYLLLFESILLILQLHRALSILNFFPIFCPINANV